MAGEQSDQKSPPYHGVGQQPVGVRIMRPKILCAEDEPLIQHLYRAVLRDVGEVVIASDGRKAVEIFQQSPDDYGLILTDYKMPGMNGLEVLTVLQSYSRPPRLLLSSGADQIMKERALAVRALAVLRKPVDNQLLKAIARELLAGERSLTLEEYVRGRAF